MKNIVVVSIKMNNGLQKLQTCIHKLCSQNKNNIIDLIYIYIGIVDVQCLKIAVFAHGKEISTNAPEGNISKKITNLKYS